MKFCLQKYDFVVISLALAVIIFVMLLPSPKGNNPAGPPDSKHGASSWRSGERDRLFLL